MMRVAAFIPARGGSKRVPGKNLAVVGGVSLVVRAGLTAVDGGVDDVWISTDSEEIAEHVHMVNAPLRVHMRPAPLASDHAQIESAIAHWYTRLDTKPDVIVLLQPTSPFRTAEHVRAALALLAATGCDSVIGVTQSHAPHFAGRMKPRETASYHCLKTGHNENNCSLCTPRCAWYEWQPFAPLASADARPRTQDLPPRGWENGSLYVTRREAWERSGMRVSGNIAALPMSWVSGLDIDTQEDLDAARALAEGLGI